MNTSQRSDTVLILEDERERMVTAFAAVGYSVQDLDRALKTLADAFAPPKIALSGHDFRGLEAHVLLREKGNHPDGWCRMFYNDSNVSKSLRVSPRGSQGGQKFHRRQSR